MNLQPLIERYVAYRQALGESFKTNAIVLRAFGRAIGSPAAVAAVGTKQVRAFLDGKGPITSAWFGRHSALLGFYHYAISRGYVAVSPLPAVLPQRPPPFVPHIYTQDELRRLLRATDSYQRQRSSLEPVTMRVFPAALRGWSAPPRSDCPRPRRRGHRESPAQGAPGQVLQDPVGPFEPEVGGRLGRVRTAAGRTARSRSRGSVLHDAPRARG